MDGEVMDFTSCVHLKLSIQFESRVRELEEVTCCTLLFVRSSAIVTEMLNAGRADKQA